MRRVAFLLVAPFERFLRTEFSGAALLVGAAAVALVWANSRFAGSYHRLAALPLGLHLGAHGFELPLRAWVNDVAMAFFFLVAGMEIRREPLHRRARTPARAALPLAAALGGMVAPAGLYALVARGTPAASGWGIPMATDIAFSLGVLGLVRRRVPPSLLVFLTALAIFDDLGAIAVIALFYGAPVAPLGLSAAGRSRPPSRCCPAPASRRSSPTSSSARRCGSRFTTPASTRRSRGWSRACASRRSPRDRWRTCSATSRAPSTRSARGPAPTATSSPPSSATSSRCRAPSTA